MNTRIKHTLILAVLWVATSGMGSYLVFVQQEKELEQLNSAEKVARLQQAEVTTLLAEEASSARVAEETIRKWQSRYKVIPETLSTAGVVRYLENLTESGYKNFDIAFSGASQTPDYSVYSFAVTGHGYYASLYDFIWHIENNPTFYRIRDLQMNQADVYQSNRETGKERKEVMVAFSFNLDAYFAGSEGVSAPEAGVRATIPPELFPVHSTASNPFFPLIMKDLPPNSDELVDVEKAMLVSVAGDRAVFRDEKGFRPLKVGDKVYLGHILRLDPAEGRVYVYLNKGGLVDEVVIELESGERKSVK